MKKFYYFSEKSLNFLEIKHFKEKTIAIFTISVIFLSGIVLGLIYLFTNTSGKDVIALKEENLRLKNKIKEIADNYAFLDNELQNLISLSNELRLAANLNPITPEERKVGIGGGNIKSNENILTFSSDISEAISLTESVKRKFDFEKTIYKEITLKLQENKNLFESIPAIVPTFGSYSIESFGMRVHPILGYNKMHSGIDIIADIGTPVKASGKGKVEFVGVKGGYGLTVEISHGFGYKTVYAHLSNSLVKEGQIIKRGQIIAKTGNSGLSSGPHLHYEVIHNGQNLDPSLFFFDEYSYFETNISN